MVTSDMIYRGLSDRFSAFIRIFGAEVLASIWIRC
jgi:hypothetical protein